MSCPVSVYVRVRPLNTAREGLAASAWTQEETSSVLLSDPGRQPRAFTFDGTFAPGSTQAQVFQAVGYPAVAAVLQGYNASVLAYGQTGTGKTFTMLQGGKGDDRGLAGRSVEALFAGLAGTEFLCRCSCLEIYLESISDLLNTDPRAPPVQLREDLTRGVFVQGLTEAVVYSAAEVEQVISRALKSRHVSGTALNSQSSRSHCLFQLHVERKQSQGAVTHARRAKLNLVDLAGSERISASFHPMNARETGSINKSLSALTNVISALTAERATFVPYRDSKLTHLLKDSLGGNSFTSFIATLSPAASAIPESLATLQFAQRAKNIVCRAVVNDEVVSASAEALTREVKELRARLQNLLERPQSEHSKPVGYSERERRLEIMLAGALHRELETGRVAAEHLRAAKSWEQQALHHSAFAEAVHGLEKIQLLEGKRFGPGARTDSEEIRLLRQLVENHPDRSHRVRLEQELGVFREELDRLRSRASASNTCQCKKDLLRRNSTLMRSKSSFILNGMSSRGKPAPHTLKRIVNDPDAQFLSDADIDDSSPQIRDDPGSQTTQMLQVMLAEANREVAYLLNKLSQRENVALHVRS
jgi:Kinesin motor domain